MPVRPDSVPQDVWEAAERHVSAELSGHGRAHKSSHGMKNIIARAIMAAKTEAYSEAADLAQRIGVGRQAQSAQAKAAKATFVSRDFESMAMSAFEVADAIRKRQSKLG